MYRKVKESWDILKRSLGFVQGVDATRLGSNPYEIVKSMSQANVSSLRKERIKELIEGLGSSVSSNFRKNEKVEKLMVLKEQINNGDILPTSESDRSVDEIIRAAEENLNRELIKAAVESWVMKPLVSTSGMKDGSLNESEVLRALPNFF